MTRLKDKVALVTAATKGIGKECAMLFAKEGAIVYIGARNEQLANEVIDEIRNNGGRAKFAYFNAYETRTYEEMINNVLNNEGKLDILVNNYGGTNVELDKDLVPGDQDEFFRIINTNMQSVYLPMKYAIPSMINNGGGSIINISTIGSVVPDFSRLGYVVSKAAINALTQNTALQYAKYNVRCNAVLPGLIGTKAALENMPNEFRELFLKHVPLRRVGHPMDIASAVLFFASDESSYITGDLMEVAGGFAIGTPLYGDVNASKKK